ncbi:DUF1456 family protein [Marinomonas shanghaiensis]|uniref:DUF1456 family protein n=1 Tax=Marinomonas shanghaiensis TaxID=2202418 RepID=UPI000DBA177E|nr:DUF1456 family protein [Marinomonas shanghaiensis]
MIDNNSVLKKLCYILKPSRSEMLSILAAGGYETSKSQIDRWLSAPHRKKTSSGNTHGKAVNMYKPMPDEALEAFVNGLIIYNFDVDEN